MSIEEEHLLTVNNDKGVGEALEILLLEFSRQLYSPTSETDEKYLDILENGEPRDLQRYTHVEIGGKKYDQFDQNMVEAFLKHRKATLYTHPITKDYAYIYIKLFI